LAGRSPLFQLSFNLEHNHTFPMKYIVLLVLLAPVLFMQPLAAVGSGTQQPSAVSEETLTAGVGKDSTRPAFRSITPAVAAQLIEQRKDLLVVDVRTPEERKQFRIAGSQLVPVGDVMRGRFTPELERPILMICAVGGRSYIAGKMMTARGYREVYNLDGGIESWRKAGLPLETGREEAGSRHVSP
jgi:rhodanese-related sulfurtransferase